MTAKQTMAAGKRIEAPLRAARVAKVGAICAEAERQFAQYGFEGTSLDMIAQTLGISRQNLLYYFPSKELMYIEVLDNVLDEWRMRMDGLVSGADPGGAGIGRLRR